LIVLNIGLQAGILSTRSFSVMVIMCLFTTIIAFPIVQCIYPPSVRTYPGFDNSKIDPIISDEEEFKQDEVKVRSTEPEYGIL